MSSANAFMLVISSYVLRMLCQTHAAVYVHLSIEDVLNTDRHVFLLSQKSLQGASRIARCKHACCTNVLG